VTCLTDPRRSRRATRQRGVAIRNHRGPPTAGSRSRRMTASTGPRRQDSVRLLAAATTRAQRARSRSYDVDGAINDRRASVVASLRKIWATRVCPFQALDIGHRYRQSGSERSSRRMRRSQYRGVSPTHASDLSEPSRVL